MAERGIFLFVTGKSLHSVFLFLGAEQRRLDDESFRCNNVHVGSNAGRGKN